MNRLLQKFRHDLVGIGLVAFGVFVLLALFSYHPMDPSFNSSGLSLKVLNYCGYVGSFLADGLFQLFGLSSWLFALGLMRLGYLSFQGEAFSMKDLRLVWGSLLVLTFSSLVATYFPETKLYQGQIYLGGIVGLGLSQVLSKAFNHIGVQVVLWSITAVLIVFYSEKTVQELAAFPLALVDKLKKIRWTLPRPPALPKIKLKAKPEVKVAEKPKEKKEKLEIPAQFIPLKADMEEPEQEEMELDEEEEEIKEPREPQRRKVVMKAKVSRRVENWELPKISMLEDPPATRFKIDEKEIRRKAETLTDKLMQFSVTGEVVAAKPGPAVTMFEFKPSANVRLSKITELEDDLSLALSSESLRIIAPIPGRDVVGIETSNHQRETVYLKIFS